MATRKQDWLPFSYDGLYNKSLMAKTYLEGHLGDLGINGKTAEWVNSVFKVKWQAFANAYLAWQNEAQRTPQKVAALNETKKELVPVYRELYKFLKANPVVKDDDLVAMGFPQRSVNPPTPVPKPTTRPVMTIDIGTPRRLTVHYVDSHTGKKGKPKGVTGAVVRWAVLPVPPVDDYELYHSVLNTNSPFIIDFKEEERHHTAYFLLEWQNTRGERGPLSDLISAVIP